METRKRRGKQKPQPLAFSSPTLPLPHCFLTRSPPPAASPWWREEHSRASGQHYCVVVVVMMMVVRDIVQLHTSPQEVPLGHCWARSSLSSEAVPNWICNWVCGKIETPSLKTTGWSFSFDEVDTEKEIILFFSIHFFLFTFQGQKQMKIKTLR